ncbi:MAG: adenylate/guanylate cyclase domain-containing protein [Flavobacteriales bacterium]|nr:tetratricopeptide repeat protein [Flavobacteriales bacterium]
MRHLGQVYLFAGILGVTASAAPPQNDSLWGIWSTTHLPDSARLKAMQILAWRAVFVQPDSGMALAQMQLVLADSASDDRARYEAYTTLAVGSSMKSDYPLALSHLQQCLTISRKMGDLNREANAYSNLSNVYRNLGDLPTALTQLQKSLRIDTQLGNDEGLAGTYNNIGNVHTELHDLAEALENYELSAALYAKGNNVKGRAQALMNLGATHLDLGERTLALEEFNESLALYRSMGRTLETGMAYNNLGRNYGELGRIQEAYAALDSAHALFTEIGSARQLSRNLYHRGTLLLKQGNAIAARNACDKGLKVARKSDLDLQRKECSECLMQAYEQLGDLSSAFHAQKEYMAVSDSLDQRNNAKEVLRLDLQRQFQQQQIADSLVAERARFAVELSHSKELGREERRRNLLILGAAMLLLLAGGLWNRLRFTHRSRSAIAREKERSDDLLHNILPQEVASELKEKGRAQARHLDEVTVLFTDLKGFTQISKQFSPAELVAELDTCFRAFDAIVGKYQVEKIKTIGDAYMAAGGVPEARNGSAVDTVCAALAMQKFMVERYRERSVLGLPAFQMRVGCHSGPVVAGIVGSRKFQYDIWGDTVNTASRMESSGEVGQVNISAATLALLQVQAANEFQFTARGLMDAKGKGALEMFFVSEV